MFDLESYQLLDFGQERKLERFGSVVIDRPCPAAEGKIRATPDVWSTCDLRYDRIDGTRGKWSGGTRDPWTIRHGELTFELNITPFGHVGIFPEQAANWDWLQKIIRRQNRPLKVLNLFAYTGGSTLAAAAAGAEVTHVDSSKTVVAWARRNAQLSGMAEAPIRWIVEDCQKFVNRELRRQNRYDAIILDPPSYGHGPKNEVWKLSQHILPLLQACAELTADHRALVLLTCHSPGYGPAEMSALLEDSFFGRCQSGAVSRRLKLVDPKGRKLDCGVVARWPA